MNRQQQRITYLCSILRWLEKVGLPIERLRLAEKCNVNEKTIRRDINYLVKEGIFDKLYNKKKLYLKSTGKYLRFNNPKKENVIFKSESVEKSIDVPNIQPVEIETPLSQPVETFEKAQKQTVLIKEKLDNYGVQDFYSSKISKNVKIKSLRNNFDDIGIILYIYDNYIQRGQTIKNVNGLYQSIKKQGYEITYDLIKKYCKNVHDQEHMSAKMSTKSPENVHDAKHLYNSDYSSNKLVNKQQQDSNNKPPTSSFNFLPKDEQDRLIEMLNNDEIQQKAQQLLKRRREKASV